MSEKERLIQAFRDAIDEHKNRDGIEQIESLNGIQLLMSPELHEWVQAEMKELLPKED